MAHNSLPVPLPRHFERELVGPQSARHPWIYPQLLSLDTPLVAVSWHALFVRAFHKPGSSLTVLVLALCVWLIYAADHLFDVQRGSGHSERHHFVLRHRKLFCFFIAVAVLISSAMLLELPREVLFAGIALSIGVVTYFVAVHSQADLQRFVPKEAAVALLFAAGSSITIWSSAPVSLPAWTTILCFSVLCLINCCMVDVRESHPNLHQRVSPHRLTKWLGTRNTACGMAGGMTTVSITALHHVNIHLRIALLGASASLFLISFVRHRLSADAFRFAADLALLVPALVALL